MSGEPSDALDPSATDGEVRPSAPDGRTFSPRAGIAFLAALAAVVLVALVAYLVWLVRPVGLTQKGGQEQAGLIPVLSIYGPGTGSQPRFASPMSAAWGQGDRIYAADTKNNRVVVFSRDGRYQFQFGGLGSAKPTASSPATWRPGLLDYPTSIATDPNTGDVYVADFYNDSISVFDAKGAFLRRFPDPAKPLGSTGGAAGHGGIAVAALAVADGKVYATDTHRVVVFDTQGNVLRQFGRSSVSSEALDHPNGIAVDSSGRIYVSDSNNNRLVAYSADGRPLWSADARVSGSASQSANPFVLPRGLTLLADGSILVADPLGQQIVRLADGGRLLARYGSRGSGPGQLNFPNDLAARNGLILVADKENNRVQVVRLGGR